MTNEETIEVLDNMKIKIDIPKQALTQHKRNEALDKAIKALEKKSVLDKIRAEIAEISKKYPMTMDYENGLKEALGIIDKYKAESEE